MYTRVIEQAIQPYEGQLPPGFMQALVNVLGNCQLPLEHRGPIDVTASPANGQRIYVDDLFTDENTTIENPTYSTLNVSNPFSVFVDGDNPYFDGGSATWNQGVSWSTWSIANFAYFNNVKTKNIKIEKLTKDGYQFQDIEVPKSITFDLSDPCAPSADIEWRTIRVLVADEDADGGSGDDDDDGSQNQPADPSSPGDPAIPNNDPHNSGDTFSTGDTPTAGQATPTSGADQQPFWDTTVQEGYPQAGDRFIPPPVQEDD
jgi:hypothetical protein